MLTKWSYVTIGSIALLFVAVGAGCGPATIEQGSGGSGGAGASSTTASSTGSGGAGGTGMSVACDPMNLPPEGSPCMKEGEVCSPGCQDPCSFCNIKTCGNGVWTTLEVFPAQCLSCEEVCVPVVAAQCSGGPPDQMKCVQGCNQNQMGNCKIVFNEMLACIGAMPTFSCDAMNRPTVTGCETQFQALYACIMP